MLLNHNNEAVEVPLTGSYQDVLAGSSLSGPVRVGPYDVSVLLEE
jgi:beta-galactosidase GanA